jgi:hypothetical protein
MSQEFVDQLKQECYSFWKLHEGAGGAIYDPQHPAITRNSARLALINLAEQRLALKAWDCTRESLKDGIITAHELMLAHAMREKAGLPSEQTLLAMIPPTPSAPLFHGRCPTTGDNTMIVTGMHGWMCRSGTGLEAFREELGSDRRAQIFALGQGTGPACYTWYSVVTERLESGRPFHHAHGDALTTLYEEALAVLKDARQSVEKRKWRRRRSELDWSLRGARRTEQSAP